VRDEISTVVRTTFPLLAPGSSGACAISADLAGAPAVSARRNRGGRGVGVGLGASDASSQVAAGVV